MRPALGQRLDDEKSLQCVVINLIVQSVMEPIQFTFIVTNDDGRAFAPERVVYFRIVRFAVAIVVQEIGGDVRGVVQLGLRYTAGGVNEQPENLNVPLEGGVQLGQTPVFAFANLEIRSGVLIRLAKRLLDLLSGERRGRQTGSVDQIRFRLLVPAEADVFRFADRFTGDNQFVLLNVGTGREPFTVRPL